MKMPAATTPVNKAMSGGRMNRRRITEPGQAQGRDGHHESQSGAHGQRVLPTSAATIGIVPAAFE